LRCLYRRVRLAVPSDALSANPSIREKTLVAGYIARAAAALRAEGIDVYGPPGPGSDVLMAVLKYLSYPAYLRKLAFPIRPELKYAGILPPVTVKALNEGFVDREEGLFFKFGLIVNCAKGSRAVVEVGEERPLTARVKNCKKNALVLIGRNKKGRIVKVVTAKHGIWRGEYLGFEVREFDSIYEVVEFYRKEGLPVIVTSRMGEWPGRLREFVPGNLGILFGSPEAGIPEKYPDLRADAVVNVVPCQGTKTIRLEEAIWATVGLVSSLEAGLCE